MFFSRPAFGLVVLGSLLGHQAFAQSPAISQGDLVGSYAKGSYKAGGEQVRYFMLQVNSSTPKSWENFKKAAEAAAKKVVNGKLTLSVGKRYTLGNNPGGPPRTGALAIGQKEPNNYYIIGATDGKDTDWYAVIVNYTKCTYYSDDTKQGKASKSTGGWVGVRRTLSNKSYLARYQFADDDNNRLAVEFILPTKKK